LAGARDVCDPGRNASEEVFELAAPGKEFELYSRTRLTRVK